MSYPQEDPDDPLADQGELCAEQDEESRLWRWSFYPFIGKRLISVHQGSYCWWDQEEALKDGREEVLLLLGYDRP